MLDLRCYAVIADMGTSMQIVSQIMTREEMLRKMWMITMPIWKLNELHQLKVGVVDSM